MIQQAMIHWLKKANIAVYDFNVNKTYSYLNYIYTYVCVFLIKIHLRAY